MKEEELPRNIVGKGTETFYIAEYSVFYLRQKAKILGEGMKKKKEFGLGRAIDQAIIGMPDFKETINDYFEENKL